MRLSTLLAAACAAALVGCDYTVPLTEKPEQATDAALLGAWERKTEQGEVERLLILPLSKTEYLVSFPAGSKDALFARACLCQAGGMKLVQLTWFGTARGDGDLSDDGRVYQFASYTAAGDTLSGRLLNADTVSRQVTSTEALVKALVANKENPALFREAMAFTKVKPPADPQAQFKRPPMPAAWK
jgi:hypothetical protein